jgi:Dolichyl-phosphate-mannose-protein mannosyltransferase
MRRAFCAVVLLALACLLPRAVRIGMTGDYVDAIGKVTAQDEALYGHSAISMAQRGDWLTPHFMGRLALYKPPMLIWLSGVSAKIFGITRLTLRLPVVLIAVVGIGILFLWGAETGGVIAGACVALFLIGDRLFNTLSTLVMTDALLVTFTIAAIYAIYSDPWLESRAALWGFAAATAGAILTKGIAGVFPIAILGLHWIVVRPKESPASLRVLLAVALAIALAAPWFLYQLAVHPRWFWTEHIAVEILGYGAGAPPQTSRENPVMFYLLRLAATDPVLFSCAVVALPSFVRSLRDRSAGPTLIACWLVLTTAAALAWQYRNASYLLPIIPALALIAACYGPFAEGRHGTWMLAMLCVGLVVKAALPDAPWGLNYRAGTINPVAPALSEYCEQQRNRDLIVVDTADDLYAAVLPISARYVAVGPAHFGDAFGMPWDQMGIAVTGQQYRALARLRPTFESRLREWGAGADASRSVASLITVNSPQELGLFARTDPDDDFLIPERYRGFAKGPEHVEVPAAPGYLFLLAPTKRELRAHPAWTCRM